MHIIDITRLLGRPQPRIYSPDRHNQYTCIQGPTELIDIIYIL